MSAGNVGLRSGQVMSVEDRARLMEQTEDLPRVDDMVQQLLEAKKSGDD